MASPAMKTIGLCMIVKNEAQVILCCLQNVRPLIDYALIVDTGSTDGTQTIARRFLSEHRLSGEVIEEPWRNFAYNRTFALSKLRERTTIDYALVVDADDTLVFADSFDTSKFKAGLDKDFYHVEIHLGVDRTGGWQTRFFRPQILSNRLEFTYKGVLHEFVAGPRTVSSSGVASGLYIEAGTHGARSNNLNKYCDDGLTLEKALQTETDEFIRARYIFYLAMSWMNAGEKEKALAVYLQRAELDAFHEEVSLSLYYAAQMKDALGYPETEVIGCYLKAYEADPKRAEPLHGAMDYCRRKHRPQQGYLIGKHAISIPEPVGSLFVVAPIYDYGILEEFSVAAYRSGHYRECLQTIEKLLSDGKIPESARQRLRDNARIAAEKSEELTRAATEAATSGRPIQALDALGYNFSKTGPASESEEAFTILYNNAEHLRSMGRPFDEAIVAYERASHSAPNRAEALHGASRLCRETERFTKGYPRARIKARVDDTTKGFLLEQTGRNIERVVNKEGRFEVEGVYSSDVNWTVLAAHIPGYIHSAALYELVEAVYQGLKQLDRHVSISNGSGDIAQNTIVIAGHLLSPERCARVPDRAIIYNSEHSESHWFKEHYTALLRRTDVWDYSADNALRLAQRLGRRVLHVPLGYVPQLTRIGQCAPIDEDIDVLFFGSRSPRRQCVFDEIRSRGLVFHHAFGAYGADRDALIKRAKIVLNLHQYLPGSFEILRMAYLLSNRKAVVSELNPGETIDSDLEGGFVATPYENIGSAVANLVANPVARNAIAGAGYRKFICRSEAAILRDALGERLITALPVRLMR
jgi:glycosyltransferase involved in cell wall biosynthesis